MPIPDHGRGPLPGRSLDVVRAALRRGNDPAAVLDDASRQALRERYAVFADQRDADGFLVDSQVILKDLRTPRPSLHMMASCHDREDGVWGSFWDQFGGGFSCLDSVMAGRMSSHLDTNYVPTAPQPQDARGFYVHEGGKAWPMFMQADHEEGRYAAVGCRHGLDRHEMTAQRHGLRSRLEVMVHPDLPLELMRVTIRNVGRRPRHFSWFCRIRVNVDSFPFYYFVPRVVCEGIVEGGALVFLNHDQANRHPRQAFLAAEPHFDGFDMMGEAFDGIGGRAPLPPAVQRGACSGSLGIQPYAGLVAAVEFKACLRPGESAAWTLGYGACPAEKQARTAFIRKVRKEALRRSGHVAGRLAVHWADWIGRHKIRTPSADLDRYFNVWSRYQARNQSRFCRALDKVGYRDVLQDLLGICAFDPEYVRTMLLRTLHYQLADGRAVRQFEKFPGAGCDLRMYLDSPSWIPDTLAEYLKETGDFALLDEEVPYFDEGAGRPDPTSRGTVYEHALKAVRSLADNAGHHGLCRIGYGDWNDALSGIGGRQGVSVWLSCACVHAARIMAEIAARTGRARDAAEMRRLATRLAAAVNRHGWDGQWYLYAIDDQGRPIGGAQCPEGKIHLNVNAWAIFTGVAAHAGREEAVWAALKALETPFGHLLLAPSYTAASRREVGRIADIMPGMFENGSIYLHGEAFFLYALAARGRPDECLAGLLRVLPSSMFQDVATGPRHQQSNFTVGPDHPAFGAQLFSNFTGSLSWFRRVVVELLGVKAGFDALSITAAAPASWPGYEIVKIWRGRRVHVRFTRAKKTSGRPSLLLNGQPHGPQIPLADLDPAQTNRIDVSC